MLSVPNAPRVQPSITATTLETTETMTRMDIGVPSSEH